MGKLTSTNFKGYKIYNDRCFDNVQNKNTLVIPFIDSNDLPPAILPGVGGGIAYDTTTGRLYKSDGFTWTPVGGGGGSGTVATYSFIKGAPDLPIPCMTPTILSNWSIAGSDAYHTLPEWDLITGIYTATAPQYLSLNVNISWAGGISNLGNRTVRIERFDALNVILETVKEAETQADPNLAVDTTQEVSTILELGTGDQVYVEIEHNAPFPLDIKSSFQTSISGFKVFI